MEVGYIQPSIRKNYPDNYRFIGIQIFVEEDRAVITRETPDLLLYFALLGGFLKSLDKISPILYILLGKMALITRMIEELYKTHSE